MKKILLIAPLLLAGCVYPWERISQIPLPSSISAPEISAWQSHDGSGATLTQSEPMDATTPKIMFEKHLSPNIRIVQGQHDTDVFFRDQKIASVANTISSDLEYEMIGDDIVRMLQTSQFDPANFSDAQKRQFGQLFAQKYFYLYDQNPYSDQKITIPDGISLLTHRVYEWPSRAWIIDESHEQVQKLDGEVYGVMQIERHGGGWLVLGQNSYGDDAWEYLDWYRANGTIYHLPLRKLAPESGKVHDRFEVIGKNQVNAWLNPLSSWDPTYYTLTIPDSD